VCEAINEKKFRKKWFKKAFNRKESGKSSSVDAEEEVKGKK
jgi:hypothetical protein